MKTIFLRVIEADDKAMALHEAIRSPESPARFAVDPKSFGAVPRSPFAYWVGDGVRRLFQELPELASRNLVVSGTGTLDDFRFLRLWWEVEGKSLWFPYAKGGSYATHYFDHYLSVKWQNDGLEMKSWIIVRYGGGHWARNIRSTEHYFRPGLTWPRRAHGLSFRVMPRGCIFADKGPAAFVDGDDPSDLLALAAVTNSRPFGVLVALQLARTELAQSFEVGLIQQTPVPELPRTDRDRLAALARRAWSLKRRLDTRTETSHAFDRPALLQVPGDILQARAQVWNRVVVETESELSAIQAEIDDRCFALYGIDGEDRCRAECGFAGSVFRSDDLDTDNDDESGEDSEPIEADVGPLVRSLLSWLVGVAFGRFDVRLATADRECPCEAEPFDPLPICSPGMLTGAQGLPANGPPRGYAMVFPPDGVLVDDPGFNGAQPHRDDIVRRVREVFDLLWKDKSHEIEQEACDILGVSELRDYFRRTAGFFPDHLKRYSKSRRKAPIYWPLSTSSGSYTIWLYYHRLNEQTLYGAVNKYIEPKISEVERGIIQIENDLKAASGREATRLTNRLGEARTFVGELRDLREELLRIAALPFKPDLNDGVIINAAPFHKLFRLRPWAKDTEECWEKLGKGDYDWARLAYTIWPERVREVCRKDRSIAIAHGLEDICEVESSKTKMKRKIKEDIDE